MKQFRLNYENRLKHLGVVLAMTSSETERLIRGETFVVMIKSDGTMFLS